MLKQQIESAVKNAKSDLVITNVQVVDVFSQDIFTADVAINDGLFVGIGEYRGFGREEIDGTGKYLVPGLIDAHAHIESTLVTPVEYSNVCLPRGITGVIADPHEIANVCGAAGIKFMLECGRKVPMDIHLMLPSCVPATAFEHSGATMTAKDLRPLYDEDGVLGLAEVMDFPAVLNGNEDMLCKINDADKRGCRIDGHCAGFGLDQLNMYATANIRTDHECDTAEGVVDRARRGIYTLIREGTVCKDLNKMLPAVNERNSSMLCFATDDKHLDDIFRNGGVDNNIRMAIAGGVPAPTAIQMGSLNVARCYKLERRGAVAPGYHADFSLVTDLNQLSVEKVYKQGALVAENGAVTNIIATGDLQIPEQLLDTVHLPEIGENDLAISMNGCSRANIIEIVPGTVVSNHLVEEVKLDGDYFAVSTENDQLKICVVERHSGTGKAATAIVKGLKLTRGAIATTIAHDSHNLIIVGTNDQDMLVAADSIRHMQGGIVVVEGGRELAAVELEIGGLITGRKAEDVLDDLDHLHRQIAVLAPECSFNPVLALSFMSLVVIPELKLCDSGLFSFGKFDFIPVPVGH